MDCEFYEAPSAAGYFALENRIMANKDACQAECTNNNQFVCRSYHFDGQSGNCLLSPDDSVSTIRLRDPPGNVLMHELDRCVEG